MDRNSVARVGANGLVFKDADVHVLLPLLLGDFPHLPYVDHAVLAARRQVLPVAAEFHRPDRVSRLKRGRNEDWWWRSS